MSDRSSQPLLTPEQEIAILRARIAELERELEKARRERESALGALHSIHRVEPQAAAVAAARASGEPLPEDACTYCEGYGSHWIHDIEMMCLKCGGTGRTSRA